MGVIVSIRDLQHFHYAGDEVDSLNLREKKCEENKENVKSADCRVAANVFTGNITLLSFEFQLLFMTLATTSTTLFHTLDSMRRRHCAESNIFC